MPRPTRTTNTAAPAAQTASATDVSALSAEMARMRAEMAELRRNAAQSPRQAPPPPLLQHQAARHPTPRQPNTTGAQPSFFCRHHGHGTHTTNDCRVLARSQNDGRCFFCRSPAHPSDRCDRACRHCGVAGQHRAPACPTLAPGADNSRPALRVDVHTQTTNNASMWDRLDELKHAPPPRTVEQLKGTRWDVLPNCTPEEKLALAKDERRFHLQLGQMAFLRPDVLQYADAATCHTILALIADGTVRPTDAARCALATLPLHGDVKQVVEALAKAEEHASKAPNAAAAAPASPEPTVVIINDDVCEIVDPPAAQLADDSPFPDGSKMPPGSPKFGRLREIDEGTGAPVIDFDGEDDLLRTPGESEDEL